MRRHAPCERSSHAGKKEKTKQSIHVQSFPLRRNPRETKTQLIPRIASVVSSLRGRDGVVSQPWKTVDMPLWTDFLDQARADLTQTSPELALFALSFSFKRLGVKSGPASHVHRWRAPFGKHWERTHMSKQLPVSNPAKLQSHVYSAVSVLIHVGLRLAAPHRPAVGGARVCSAYVRPPTRPSYKCFLRVESVGPSGFCSSA